jgi:hypothetical protein
VLLCVGYKLGELSNDGALSQEYTHQFAFDSLGMTTLLGSVVFGAIILFATLCVHEIRRELTALHMRELLVFVCSPTKQPLSAVLPEAQEVEAAFDSLITTASVKVETVSVNCSPDELREKLCAIPTRRFLFGGHANMIVPSRNASQPSQTTLGTTLLGGGLDLVQPNDLVSLFGLSSKGSGGILELVFLNGCNSETLGEAVLRAGVPTVVCWRTSVDDDAARLFSRAFFKAVAQGHNYERA